MAADGPYPRLLKPPRQSFFLFGMRGVGKSHWAQCTFPAAPRFDLLDEGLYQTYLRDPGQFGRELAAIPRGGSIIVDEIQRLPALLNEVHRAIEEHRQRFVLLGSSARKLKQAGTNLLAGRALRRLMLPLLPEELDADFDLTRILRYGSLPVIWQSTDPDDSLNAYVQLYLHEEIQAEALVRNLPGFARFLPVAALFHGQVLNAAGLARDAGVARSTVMGYLDILADTHVAWLVPAFEPRLRVKERQHPKFYWVNPGVVRAVRRDRHPPTAQERGPLFEGWIATVLRAYGDPDHGIGHRFDGLFYWSPPGPSGSEVDFVVKRRSATVALEVKAKTAIASRDLNGLRAMAELPGLSRRLVVFLGDRAERTADGIDVLPVRAFLREVADGRI